MTSVPNLNYHLDDNNIFETAKDIFLEVKPNWKRSDIKFKVNTTDLAQLTCVGILQSSHAHVCVQV